MWVTFILLSMVHSLECDDLLKPSTYLTLQLQALYHAPSSSFSSFMLSCQLRPFSLRPAKQINFGSLLTICALIQPSYSFLPPFLFFNGYNYSFIRPTCPNHLNTFFLYTCPASVSYVRPRLHGQSVTQVSDFRHWLIV